MLPYVGWHLTLYEELIYKAKNLLWLVGILNTVYLRNIVHKLTNICFILGDVTIESLS